EKMDKIEKLIIDGKVTLMDDEGKPLEKWKESYENDDYEYDPYADDMYEGQEIPKKLQVYSSCGSSLTEVVCLCNGWRCGTHPHPLLDQSISSYHKFDPYRIAQVTFRSAV
ncbi:hypothetical protein Tco_0143025, partial [Tanacetum coccineum]